MLPLNFMSWACFMFLWSVALSDDNTKNHRAERRQDNSFLFFGGWRPVRPGNPYYHGSASTHFHDILSALPNNYDSAASYYTHALPTQQHQKDIYSYYPRPAIKSAPKKNTPVYMERYRPQKQQQKHHSRGISNQASQFINLQNIDLNHLQDLILQAKELPLSQLNLPIESGNPLEILEVSLQSMQQGNQNYGFRGNNLFSGYKNQQRNNKGGYRKGTQSHRPVQSPVQFEYMSSPKTNLILPQTLPKELEISPIKFPHSVPSIEDVVGIKNIQIVEVPVQADNSYGIPNTKGSGDIHYGQTSIHSNQPQYRTPSQSFPHKGFPPISYFAHQTEQPRKHYTPPQQKTDNNNKHQPEIKAELIKINEEELKHLLSNLQILDKSPQDLLKYLPLGNLENMKDENVQILLSPPEAGYNAGDSSPIRGYDTQKYVQQNVAYGNEEQYGEQQPQTASYQSKGTNTYSLNSGGYQRENHESHHSPEHKSAGYQIEDPSPRSYSTQYEPANYQNLEAESGYDQEKGFRKDKNQESQNSYEGDAEQYPKTSQETSKEQQGHYVEREQSYIQVISPQTDENGYRREPVLAVEIQHGQSIEDAIKSLDPETLQKLGTHGKDGIEIEVVEVPIDEYASESKKTETVVSARNSTVILKSKKQITKS